MSLFPVFDVKSVAVRVRVGAADEHGALRGAGGAVHAERRGHRAARPR